MGWGERLVRELAEWSRVEGLTETSPGGTSLRFLEDARERDILCNVGVVYVLISPFSAVPFCATPAVASLRILARPYGGLGHQRASTRLTALRLPNSSAGGDLYGSARNCQSARKRTFVCVGRRVRMPQRGGVGDRDAQGACGGLGAAGSRPSSPSPSRSPRYCTLILNAVE